MILVQTKAESVASSPLNLGNLKDEKPTLSFSELLHGAKDSKGEKGPQNGSFILSLGADEKDIKPSLLKKGTIDKETLSSLLKNDDKTTLELEKVDSKQVKTLEFNPKITENMTVKEVKTLIADAKNFLKNQILDSAAYKKAQVKELPQTLKGLAQMAKSFGIDISKITLEEVRNTPKPIVDTQLKESPKPLQAIETKETPKPLQATEVKEIPKPLQKVESKGNEKLTQNITEVPNKEVSKEILKVDSKLENSSDVKAPTLKPKVTMKEDESQEVKIKNETKEIVKESIKVDDKKLEVIKEIKATPLFKAQEKVNFTTEQIVQTKQLKVEDKTPRARADETLKLLLRGEKPSSENINLSMTKDFSVTTARVIAPSATTEVSRSMEQLLRGDDGEDIVKSEAVKTQDPDSFDVKVKEAKQMMRYLSQDVKTAIEDYKSPFTRVKVQLNPAKMGEVDLTVVQRGKNLHVNLSSNNVAINTLAMNAQDLKVQLQNNGIQNATLNFSDSSQSSEQNAQQQQNRHNERKADEEYNYFENEEQNEEVLNSLEIIVPQYV